MPLFIMNCGFMGISSSSISPYVLKISRKWVALMFLVSFSITILADRGIEGLRARERERVRVRSR